MCKLVYLVDSFGRNMVFPSYIFIYRSGTELFTSTICLWKLERRGMGKCVRNCLYGTTFDFNCLLYKAFLAKFEGILPGIIYGLFWWALLFFGVGLIAPAIKSALHLPKETIVTTICIFILYGVFIAYSVSYAVNTNKAEREGEEKTNYSNK